jgi:hypothetical protein
MAAEAKRISSGGQALGGSDDTDTTLVGVLFSSFLSFGVVGGVLSWWEG